MVRARLGLGREAFGIQPTAWIPIPQSQEILVIFPVQGLQHDGASLLLLWAELCRAFGAKGAVCGRVLVWTALGLRDVLRVPGGPRTCPQKT